MSEEAPLYVEPILGWRTWQLDTDADRGSLPIGQFRPRGWIPGTDQAAVTEESGQFRLVSGGATVWRPRERLTACCRAARDHKAPDPKCMCGIYAARTHQILRGMGYAAGPDDHYAPDLVGELWLWGRMMVSDEVLRAEFAYPKRLVVPYLRWRWARPLEETYGVPVEIRNPFTLEVD